VNDSGEELEVRSPGGELEVRITLAEDGPVVSLRGARLELEAPREFRINCGRFEVMSAEQTSLHSTGQTVIGGGEVRVKTDADIHLNGQTIRLNCEEPGHDPGTPPSGRSHRT
jgi:hypothetical protein